MSLFRRRSASCLTGQLKKSASVPMGVAGRILRFGSVFASFAAATAGQPDFLPATFYLSPNYTGATQEFQSSQRWNDICRSRITLSFLDRDNNLITDSGLWFGDSQAKLQAQLLSQNSPDLSGNGCRHVSLQAFLQYQNGINGGSINQTNGWYDFAGTGLYSEFSLGFNTAARPSTSYGVLVKFAPLFGEWQDVLLKYDPVPPQLANLTEGVGEFREANQWIRPDPSDYLGYVNFQMMRDDAPKKFRVAVADVDSAPGVTGSGIYKIKGTFDNIPSLTSANPHDQWVLFKCDPFDTTARIRPALAANPMGGCPFSATSFPQAALAGNVESWFSLNWGIKNGSNFEQLGSYADGQHIAGLWFADMAGANSASFHVFKTDRYAPCDNATSAHSCALTFTDSSGTALPGNATNNGSVRAKIFLQEGGNSGVKSDGSVNNIKLLVARQSEGGTSFLSWVNASGIQTNWTVVDNGARDKTCEEILSNPTGPVWTSPFPYYDGNYNTASTGDGTMEIPVNLSSLAEGSYWFFVCAKDIAGNWSLLYDPANSAAEPNNPLRTSSVVNLSAFNSSDFPNYNYLSTDTTHVIAGALVPSLRKRLLVDRSTPDETTPPAGESCSSDPCIVRRLLSPLPAYAAGGESDIRIAYSPVGYTNANQITVGVKLPPDNSGIKTLYWDSTPGSPTPVNAVARTAATITDCAPVLAANAAAANWVDFCFVADGNSGDTMFVWLEDNAGNNNNPAGRASRLMFIDRNPPSAVTSLLVTPNPTLSSTPALTFSTIADTSGIKEHKICYWQYWAGFGQSDLQGLHNSSPGACPSSTQLLGRTVHSSVLTHSGADNAIQLFQVPAGAPITAGRWDFAVYTTDKAGNISSPSAIYPVYLSDGNSRLDFTNEDEDYKAGGVSPRIGSSGIFTFKVRFSDYQDKAPSVAAQVWIDLDGNGVYSFSEKFGMTKNNDGSATGNDVYFDGEDYNYQRKIQYLSSTNGLISYRFYFQTDSSTSINGNNSSGDPTADNSFLLDPYDIFSFSGMMQVRNNFVRPDSSLDPVILLKPPRRQDGIVKVAVYDQRGHLVTTLIENRPYNSLDRTVIWKVKSTSLASGVYNVVYFFDEQSEFRKVVVVR